MIEHNVEYIELHKKINEEEFYKLAKELDYDDDIIKIITEIKIKEITLNGIIVWSVYHKT